MFSLGGCSVAGRGSVTTMGKWNERKARAKERLFDALDVFEDRERLTLCSVIINVIYSVGLAMLSHACNVCLFLWAAPPPGATCGWPVCGVVGCHGPQLCMI